MGLDGGMEVQYFHLQLIKSVHLRQAYTVRRLRFPRLIYTGYKRALTDADLWALGKANKAVTIVPPFIQKWREAENALR